MSQDGKRTLQSISLTKLRTDSLRSKGDPPIGSEDERSIPNPRKRKRVEASSYVDYTESCSVIFSSTQTGRDQGDRGKLVKRQCLAYVQSPNMIYPKSLYNGWQPPRDQKSETLALRDLLNASNSRNQRRRPESTPGIDDNDNDSDSDPNYTVVHLSNFRIYRPKHGVHGSVMRPLNDLGTRQGDRILLLDGFLRLGTLSHYVQGVPFETLAMDGYGTQNVSIIGKAYIQSDAARALNVWYLLEDPAAEYARYYSHFSWIADFTKHFVGFLHVNDNVHLADFRYRFYRWLNTDYGNNEIFKNWFTQYGGKTDFRTVVAANVEYLWKEAVDVQDDNRKHFIWKEVDWNQLEAADKQKSVEKRTIVTPFVYECFKGTYFADQLELRLPCEATYEMAQRRKTALGFASDRENANVEAATREMSASAISKSTDNLRVGDVIGIETEARDKMGPWGNDAAKMWYGYVQHIKQAKNKRRILHVIWLYEPPQTTCQKMFYPFSNELFFSDDCNCSEATKIYADEVKTVLSIELFASSVNERGKSFVRNTYLSDEQSFVTMNKSHLRCEHHSKNHVTEFDEVCSQYQPGQTVLVKLKGRELLEPVEVVKFTTERTVSVRKLLRRRRDFNDDQAWANELVYTTEIFTVAAEQVIQKCHVRYYSSAEVAKGQVPPPYSYGGVANFWIITSQLSHANGRSKLEELKRPYPIHLRQGFNPRETSSAPWLQSMDLFSGGGSFGRGIEVSGIVKIKWAIDYDRFAAHTYMANCSHPEDTNIFFGSACDYLALALAGKFSVRIAKIGDVDFIIIGSPCQGFSDSQPDKNSSRSRKNASMIGLAVAFIDLYRPKYAIFENVFGMSRSVGKDNVLAQLICTLVGMGYQVKQFPADAFNYGCPQNRLRVFVSITAPGLQPLSCPPHTHSTPPYVKKRRFGKTMSGIDIGMRQFNFTPFEYVTANEATKDLPVIGDGATNACIPYPDHRLSLSNKLKTQVIIRSIARYPKRSNWVKTIAYGRMPAWVLEQHKDKGQSNTWTAPSNCAFSRVDPDGLFDTIMTTVKAGDAKNGKWLHWDQHRMISIMEARRAQSYPDGEVLIGRPLDQWKIVGNSVARYVAVAVGMEVREAYLGGATLEIQQPVTAAFMKGEIALDLEGSSINEEQVSSELGSDVDSATIFIASHVDNCFQTKGESLSASSQQQTFTRETTVTVFDQVKTLPRVPAKPIQSPLNSAFHSQSIASGLKDHSSKLLIGSGTSSKILPSYSIPIKKSAEKSVKDPYTHVERRSKPDENLEIHPAHINLTQSTSISSAVIDSQPQSLTHSRDGSKIDEQGDTASPRSLVSKVLDYFPSNFFGSLRGPRLAFGPDRQAPVKGKRATKPDPEPVKHMNKEAVLIEKTLFRPRTVHSRAQNRTIAAEAQNVCKSRGWPEISRSKTEARHFRTHHLNNQRRDKEINGDSDPKHLFRLMNNESAFFTARHPPASLSAQATLQTERAHSKLSQASAAKSTISVHIPVITPPSSSGSVSPAAQQRRAAPLYRKGPMERSRFAKVRGKGTVASSIWDVE